jgi:hypothetical protein
MPAKQHPKPMTLFHLTVMLDVRARHTDVENQGIVVVDQGEDWFRQTQSLELSSIGGDHTESMARARQGKHIAALVRNA